MKTYSSKRNTKEKILFIVKIPPPYTGATMMNLRTLKSPYLNDSFIISAIKISYAQNIKELDRFSIIKVVKFLKYLLLLVTQLITFKPTLVYFQISPVGIPFFRDSIFIFIIKCFNKNILLHLRAKGINEYISKNKNKKFLLKYYKFVFNSCNVICLTNDAANDLALVYKRKPYILNNGIPVAQKYFIRQNKKVTELRILFLSNLILSKGIIDFIESIKILESEKSISFIANIVGADADYTLDDLIKIIRKNKLSKKVYVKGALYGEEKEDILKESDILVFPTYFPLETFGSVIIEAMQYGLVVISTYHNGVPEIITDGYNGLLVNKKAPKEIADKIIYLYNHPTIMSKISKNARKTFLEKYTFSHYETNMFKIFKRLINENSD